MYFCIMVQFKHLSAVHLFSFSLHLIKISLIIFTQFVAQRQEIYNFYFQTKQF